MAEPARNLPGGTDQSGQTDKPFGTALRDLLLNRPEYVTGSGNVNWSAFAEALDGVHYETLRKAISGGRAVTPHVIQDVAHVLGLRPEYFVEFRLAQAAREFDVSEVGWDAAISNLRAWADANAAPPKRKR